MTTPDDVLAFWFGEIADDGTCSDAVRQRWWKKDPAFDGEIRQRFGDAVAAAVDGGLDAWRDTPRGALAMVVLLDQFSRNAFRDTPGAFANDARALEIAEACVASGQLDALEDMERYFLLMPYMHSEDLAIQQRGLALFEQAARTCRSAATSKALTEACGYMRRHMAIIERFGRYPHRNRLLGRTSSAEEVAFLEEPGSSF